MLDRGVSIIVVESTRKRAAAVRDIHLGILLPSIALGAVTFTLLAFSIVCAAVLLLRIRRPDAHRPFRCPAVYVVAPLGIAVNLLRMLFLPVETWLRLAGWLILGLIIYFLYGRFHSVIGRELAAPAGGPAPSDAISRPRE